MTLFSRNKRGAVSWGMDIVNAGLVGLRLDNLADRIREVSELYWWSDIKTTEICEAYDIAHPNLIGDLAVPAVLAAVGCRQCRGEVSARSRSAFVHRLRYLRFERDDGRLRAYYLPGLHLANHAWPDLCEECRRDIELEDQRRSAQRRASVAARLQDLRRMPYRDYLRTPEWQTTREGALRRARFRCQTCSSHHQLNVHHRTYIRRGAEQPSDLIVLCRGCHGLFHENAVLAEGGRSE